MNRIQAAQQLRRALQLMAKSFSDQQAMEVAAVFDFWQPGIAYETGDFLLWGENTVGDPQLYKVLQSHTSQADWMPQDAPALYAPIGLDSSGYPLWSRPAGAHDAYQTGDVVVFNDTLYMSLIDGNVHSPEENPFGWCVKE